MGGCDCSILRTKRQMKNYYTIPGLNRGENIKTYIVRMVANEYNIPASLISKRTRLDEIVIPRQIACFLINECFRKNNKIEKGVDYDESLTLKSIANATGIDHTSVLYSVKKIKDLMSVDIKFRLKVESFYPRIDNAFVMWACGGAQSCVGTFIYSTNSNRKKILTRIDKRKTNLGSG